ncbi:MAG: hypothetical protein HY282_14490 [Nitrospirae bacterium]|nr:hypothetical protein [Candidatus Manganitrophaceae bacterium]
MNQKIGQKIAIVGLMIMGAVWVGLGDGWACSSMGPDKHVGVVKAINAPEGAITLIDAETGKPIQFTAPAALLKGVKVNDKAVVTFQMEGARLLAKEVVVR